MVRRAYAMEYRMKYYVSNQAQVGAQGWGELTEITPEMAEELEASGWRVDEDAGEPGRTILRKPADKLYLSLEELDGSAHNQVGLIEIRPEQAAALVKAGWEEKRVSQAAVDDSSIVLAPRLRNPQMLPIWHAVDDPRAAVFAGPCTCAEALGRMTEELLNSGLVEDEEMSREFITQLSNENIAKLLLQMHFGDIFTEKPNKRLAVEVSEQFGPEWAQVLYHFAVLVTKLA